MARSVDGKRCEFSNADRQLIDSVVEVLRSLGYKSSIYWSAGRRVVIGARGKPCDTLGQWRVSWTAYREEPMFRLSRKIARMRSIERGRPYESRRRRIVGIRPVPSVPCGVFRSIHRAICIWAVKAGYRLTTPKAATTGSAMSSIMRRANARVHDHPDRELFLRDDLLVLLLTPSREEKCSRVVTFGVVSSSVTLPMSQKLTAPVGLKLILPLPT